jgi:hypothetical protein
MERSALVRRCLEVLVVMTGAFAAAGCGSDPDRGGGGTPNAGATSCNQACEHIESICPEKWDAVTACEERCRIEPFPQRSLDCVMTVSDCAGVERCSN